MNEAYDKLRTTIIANLGLDYTVTGDLLKLYFSKYTRPNQLTQFFSKYDIEVLDYQSVWLISKLAARLHYAGVPRELFPRIKGVVKRFTVENGRSFCLLPDVLETLNEAGITVMLLNGAAMKTFYEPAETRYSSHIDILVHEEDIKKAGLLLERQGFRLQDVSWEQRSYLKNGIKAVLYTTCIRGNLLARDLPDIWRHSLKSDWQGKMILVPCPEMMLMIVLIQGLEASCSRIQGGQADYFVNCFLDIKSFLNIYPLRWETFIELVRKSRLMLHIRLMLDIINHLYSGAVSEEALNALPFTGHDISNVQRLILYNAAKLQMTGAKMQHNVLGYYYNGINALWNLNCYYGNRVSRLANVTDFPRFITIWNNQGINGLLSRLGGYKR